MTSWTNDDLKVAVSKSLCFSDILKNLNVVLSGSTMAFVKRKVAEIQIDTSHFDMKMVRQRSAMKKREAATVNIFIENSSASQGTVRRAAIRIIPRICSKCSNPGVHNGKPLNLQLDHVNGVRNDNRRENLRWLCPNCHSQTETYSRIKKTFPRETTIKTVSLNCDYCKNSFQRNASRVEYTKTWNQKKNFCNASCARLSQESSRKVDHKKVVERYEELGSKNAVAKEMNVSFQAISKILKKHLGPMPTPKIRYS